MTENLKYLQTVDGNTWLVEDEAENLKINYRINEVVYQERSPFQHVMVVDSPVFGRMLVLDGIVQTTSLDGHIYNEMITHVPLSIHPNPKRVLIIGGGDCGAAREVTKYEQVEEIDMVEIDELVVKACKEHLTEVSGNLSDPRVNFIFDDGIKHVKKYKDHYDVVIVDSSDPIGPATQLFERSFYVDIHAALKEDGLMVCQSQSPIFHMHILKQTYGYIQELFPISKVYTAVVPTYPGGMWSFTLGSKKYEQVMSDQFDKDTKYVSQDILKQCFALPAFLQAALK
ncbi:polyamine aminopropyltransferase [Thermoflavimicrobium dichotomicum]|uniref:Polyamine aminopropyltransferase n=1 Tax=Thermoflavimicrobium dichotomicum TaxID=46223 RepID=A0A1I3TXF4_9BACL|nr:polyamine aminopropyltransferase [Thermoflavimicrobium dichotomicum]SFJ75350.1 spermidine synthase [Thermoflavimicrobium dichotomicum]